jgi:hypothetical protein
MAEGRQRWGGKGSQGGREGGAAEEHRAEEIDGNSAGGGHACESSSRGPRSASCATVRPSGVLDLRPLLRGANLPPSAMRISAGRRPSRSTREGGSSTEGRQLCCVVFSSSTCLSSMPSSHHSLRAATPLHRLPRATRTTEDSASDREDGTSRRGRAAGRAANPWRHRDGLPLRWCSNELRSRWARSRIANVIAYFVGDGGMQRRGKTLWRRGKAQFAF